MQGTSCHSPINSRASDSDLPLLSPIIRNLSERNIIRIRDDFSSWDIYALMAEFDEWLDQGPMSKPNDHETAFYGWVKQHHERNRYPLA